MVRPKKKAAEKRSVRLVLHLTAVERRELEEAAARAKLPLATWARLRVTSRS